MEKSPGKDQLGDADLLDLSAKGDEEAFVILYQRHQGPVFRFALHMSGSRETAEEVTQDVFLALVSGLQRYSRERGALEGYLIGMARNYVRRYMNAPPANSLHAAEQQADALHEEELVSLRAAILKLPPTYREVVVLCDMEGLDYAQAAAQLGCAIGTIRSRLHRARAILAAKLRRRERCSV